LAEDNIIGNDKPAAEVERGEDSPIVLVDIATKSNEELQRPHPILVFRNSFIKLMHSFGEVMARISQALCNTLHKKQLKLLYERNTIRG